MLLRSRGSSRRDLYFRHERVSANLYSGSFLSNLSPASGGNMSSLQSNGMKTCHSSRGASGWAFTGLPPIIGGNIKYHPNKIKAASWRIFTCSVAGTNSRCGYSDLSRGSSVAMHLAMPSAKMPIACDRALGFLPARNITEFRFHCLLQNVFRRRPLLARRRSAADQSCGSPPRRNIGALPSYQSCL